MVNIDSIGATVMIMIFMVELYLTWKKSHFENEVKDMLANFVVGMCILTVGLFMKGVAFGLYSGVYEFAFFKPELSVWLWVVGFLSCDFIMYLFHLLGHKSRIFWAAHVTHHSSLYYNISVGFRVNFIHTFYRFLFWAPLCLFGIPPWMILLNESISTIWNILVHTERIGKLGFLDLIFNTPSNHRVHHGSNPHYLDKNMGGILILFDHIFGTYQPEVEKPIYGITHNIHTKNPAKIILHEYIEIVRNLSKISNFKSKIHFLFGPPGSEKWKIFDQVEKQELDDFKTPFKVERILREN
ncbi:sterol desaturase family protein [Algoriphagus kandeliae]|uniref:Sterol desaturase family protein n=2 Tax=Algoriphagus kandeliae TaxID=2562278 RepID=A0A4Y9QRR9_9BACT|nr:sterol desaturase family protein [Algoriphagus kandeliae]